MEGLSALPLTAAVLLGLSCRIKATAFVDLQIVPSLLLDATNTGAGPTYGAGTGRAM